MPFEMPRTIGIFDSGIGGLSVLAAARHKMPDVDFIYYADTDHVPYGIKSREEIVRYSLSAAEFLCGKGAEAILVACNTATSMAVDILRNTFSCPIVGMEPALKPALVRHRGEHILVTATPATICGQKLHNLLEQNADNRDRVDLVPLPELVLFAENGVFDTDTVASYIESTLPRYGYTACVLGCTHFPYFKDSFRLVLPNADLMDGTEGTINQLCYVTEYTSPKESVVSVGRVRYYRTGTEVVNPVTLDFYENLQRRALSVI